jgi:AraC family transcriptional regulator of adaptative response/methylated-DNA-[protein]-cysteine methyltransferase
MGITYTITDTKIGRLLVASSEKGLCMVSIADSDKELERKIHDQFPTESVKRDDRAMRAMAADVKSKV